MRTPSIRLPLPASALLCALLLANPGCDRASNPNGPKPPTPPGAGMGARQGTVAGAPSAPGSGAAGESGAASSKVRAAGGASGAAQAGGFPVSGPDGDQTTILVGGLVMPKPIAWVWTAPAMQFRALQYAVPANGVNSPAAELVFSVFAGGDGGPIESNLDRWANQFRATDNSAAPAKREQISVHGMPAWRIESKGAYMGMGAAAPRPGSMQLGAIIEAPGRNIFIKLVGPEATVETNRAAFDAMIAGASIAPNAAAAPSPPAAPSAPAQDPPPSTGK